MLSAIILLAPSALLPSFHRRHVIEGAGAVALPLAITTTPAAAAALTAPSAVTLSDGSAFPLASFGLQIYDDAMAERLTLQALDAGFRNFFASVLARNQVGFARAIKRSSVPREQLFICGSVVSNRGESHSQSFFRILQHRPGQNNLTPSPCAPIAHVGQPWMKRQHTS